MQMLLQNDLLLATNNPGKLFEFQNLLDDYQHVNLISPESLGISLEVEEIGTSYLENALLKAKAFSNASGKVVLADDSGLEVDALDGAPGIYSARYGDVRGPAQLEYLLERMAKAGKKTRTARFRCVVVLCQRNGVTHSFEGICEGEIGYIPRGENGFGYDPLFVFPEYGLTMAELSSNVKNKISHRSRAIEAAKTILDELFPKI